MLYTLAHRRFFEDIVNLPHDDTYADAVKQALPGHWNARVNGVWLSVAAPEHRYPYQGFKIHVSGKVSQAADIIRAAAPVCYAHDTPFKTARDPLMMSIMASKHYPRGNAGKLMTVYPPDRERFLVLIEALYRATLGFEGPYILSDRRYKDDGIVYYRYGEMLSRPQLTVDGSAQSMLTAPDGTPYKEDRLPYYKLPPWVEEPFARERSLDMPGEKVLNGRYVIEKALTFSNAGGIYRAADRETGRTVVLKEARPHTAHFRLESSEVDAFKLLDHEYAVLRMLADVPGVVEAYDLFTEWEHRFLVEEHVAGVPLARFRARRDFSLLPFDGSETIARGFCQKFPVIGMGLIELIRDVHAHEVIIGDLSPGNILIDPDTLAVRMIDFEGAHTRDHSLPESFSAQWSTPGFRHDRRHEQMRITPEDDWFALGMILYSTILPMQSLFDLEKKHRDALLVHLTRTAGLPESVPAAIRSLWDGDWRTARERMQETLAWAGIDDATEAAAAIVAPTDTTIDDQALDALLDGIDASIAALRTPTRDDQLWPGDPDIFRSNPVSLAFGACGPLLYQHQRGVAIGEDILAWLGTHSQSKLGIPPGLYTGTSGLAWLRLQLGDSEECLRLLTQATSSPLLTEDDSLLQGRAGVLLACLLCHASLKDDRLLHWAQSLGDALLVDARRIDDGLHWDRGDKPEQRALGFALGGSGIALALLYLGKTIGEERFVVAARSAMEAEIAQGQRVDDVMRWSAAVGSEVDEPYWLHGGSGVGTALIRFAALCDEPRYADLARRAADGCYSRFTVQPGQVEGMSGLGEFMLDMHRFTGEPRYRERAQNLARSVAFYAVDEAGGISFPGRGVQRLSCDYSYGSAGIGLFLNRLRHGGERLLHDLPILGPVQSGRRRPPC